MKKKTYISPLCNIVNVPQMTLLSGSPNTNVPYDPNINTGEALSPFLDSIAFLATGLKSVPIATVSIMACSTLSTSLQSATESRATPPVVVGYIIA